MRDRIARSALFRKTFQAWHESRNAVPQGHRCPILDEATRVQHDPEHLAKSMHKKPCS